MRKITTFAISAAALVGIAAAEVETSAYAGLHSEYIYRGADLGAGSLVDFGLDVAGSCDCGLDWYAGTWYASTEAGDEFDIFAGVTKDLGFGSIDLGFVRYTYLNNSNTTAPDETEAYIGFSTSYAGLDLGLTYSHGFGSLEDSNWVEGSIGYSFDISGIALSLEVAGGINVGSNFDDETYGVATLSTDIALSEDLTLTPYISYWETDDNLYADGLGNTSSYDGVVAGASVSFAF